MKTNGRVTPKSPWLGCGGSAELSSLAGGQPSNTTPQQQLANRHAGFEPASPFLGIYPKETIKHEPKATHGSGT